MSEYLLQHIYQLDYTSQILSKPSELRWQLIKSDGKINLALAHVHIPVHILPVMSRFVV